MSSAVMSLFVLGINHQTAPVSLRERVAFSADAVPAALDALRALPEVHEAALLSTCNRTELYAVADDDGQALADWLATHPDEVGDLHAYLYRHRDADAVRHLFRVATGLDSLVLGEPQILGQVKEAWADARATPAAWAASSTACSSRLSPSPSARAPTPASARIRCRSPPPRCAWRRNPSPASTTPPCC